MDICTIYAVTMIDDSTFVLLFTHSYPVYLYVYHWPISLSMLLVLYLIAFESVSDTIDKFYCLEWNPNFTLRIELKYSFPTLILLGIYSPLSKIISCIIIHLNMYIFLASKNVFTRSYIISISYICL